MNKKLNFRLLYGALLSLLFLNSCTKTAGSLDEASEMLTRERGWLISEITVNDAVTFKDGKIRPQFGGIEFERYMETVIFQKNGIFLGYFKGEAKPMQLRWLRRADHMAVAASDTAARGGEWTIAPQDVSGDSFVMKTQSTAYDFPRVTKIALKFTIND
jgi:hypothetical protein